MTQIPYPSSETITGVRWLTEPIMNTSFHGDVWSCAWADNDNLYAVADDTWGGARPFPNMNDETPDDSWGAEFSGSNLAIYQIDGTPQHTTLHLLNKMQPYGHATWREARATWKANGMTCVDGVLYLTVSQHAYTVPGDNLQRTYDATIVKSTDYGQSWSAKPAAGHPMFPGHWFSTPFFVQFGQDYSGCMDEYVYAVSNNGSWNNGNYLILGRVHRSNIGNLDANDWEFYAGLDTEQHPAWAHDFLGAQAIFSHRNNTSMTGIQFVPALDRYLLLEWAYTDLDDPARPFSHTGLHLYEAPKPWGPWRHVYSEPEWNYASYNPGMPAKWFAEDGKRLWLTSAGDFCRRYSDKDVFEYYYFTTRQLELLGTS